MFKLLEARHRMSKGKRVFFFYDEYRKALEEDGQRTCGCLIPGSV